VNGKWAGRSFWRDGKRGQREMEMERKRRGKLTFPVVEVEHVVFLAMRVDMAAA
jgi:hypothetical protein